MQVFEAVKQLGAPAKEDSAALPEVNVDSIRFRFLGWNQFEEAKFTYLNGLRFKQSNSWTPVACSYYSGACKLSKNAN